MNNREIYERDPSTIKLANEGVADVDDEGDDVLRYELDTFVCDGQYERGMSHILETYLKNIGQAQQPGVWVSGFFGSGKSHLVKMLRTLWLDTTFTDGATARGLARLPQNVRDHLHELSTQAKRHGGLHAASGTLAAGASGSVRLALLGIIFKSKGLPEKYPIARFVLWLEQEGILDEVRSHVESSGYDWQEELDNLYVAEGLHEALVKAKPAVFSSSTACAETLINLFPNEQDVSNDEMLKAIRLALTQHGQFPLTLVVLDEVQQYIGNDGQRSIAVQEVVETCCKNFGGKLLFIGTGQTAVTGTSDLRRLEGRFTVRIELSDTDVDAVVRQVVLAKKPKAQAPIEQVIQTNMGEISRHLEGTSIQHHQDDVQYLPQDYPILPVRRRFWEQVLRVLDQTGTQSQLRNQLSMTFKAVQTNLDESLGHVIPADYLYFDSAETLLQHNILPRDAHEKTMHWRHGNDDERLMARACGLVFLINKLSGANKEIGIKATVDTLADLLVENLAAGSSHLRSRLQNLLGHCELLMQVDNEYRIQTPESAAWDDEFQSQRAALSSAAYRVQAERDDRLRRAFGESANKLSLTHGESKVPRSIEPLFDTELPRDAGQKIYVWVRDGWSIDENTVRADARQAGNQSPTLFVFIPKRSPDDLRTHLINFKAANASLESRGVPSGPEGTEARAAMETTRQTAEGRISDLLNDALSGARVFQGGGNEIVGNDLQDQILEAAGNALSRLYPDFQQADHPGWAKVLEKARKGAPDALAAIGDKGEAAGNPVCKTVLGAIASGKKGADIRAQFEAPPYGWSGDAVDGALQVLLVAGLIRAEDERGRAIEPSSLERKSVGKTWFKVESATVTAKQRIQVRKLLQKLGVSAKQGEEAAQIGSFLQNAEALAERASGDAPKPERPDTQFLKDIRLTPSGNEQLLALNNQRDKLQECIKSWQEQAERVEQRWPGWQELQRLVIRADGLADIDAYRAQVESIEQQRQLLTDPDPMAPIISNLTQALRGALNKLDQDYQVGHKQGMERLDNDSNLQQLDPDQRNQLLSQQRLTLNEQPQVSVESTQKVLKTLEQYSLTGFADRIAALPSRFDNVIEAAGQVCEPHIQFIQMPRRTLKTDEDIDAWADDAKQQLKAALQKGPVSVR
jgi:hypothetical protein